MQLNSLFYNVCSPIFYPVWHFCNIALGPGLVECPGVIEGRRGSAMQDLDIRHVRAFLAVVDERSMGKAAQRLGITHSGIARRVQKLEEVLGAELLERSPIPDRATTGRTQLTEAGLALVPRAVELLRVQSAMFDAAAGPDPREMDRILATGLAELMVKTLWHDLSDADRIRIYNALAEC